MMRNVNLAHICAMCAITLLAFASIRAAATERLNTPVAIHGRLSVKGNQILDEHGDPVQLRGMSLFWSQWMGQFYNADTMRWLRDDWNVSVVRAAMAVGAGGYLQHPQDETRRIETVVDAAIDLGIYVIIDWHAHEPQTSEASQFFAKMATKYGKFPNVIFETYNEPLARHDWSTTVKPYHQAVVDAIRATGSQNLIICGTQTWSQDVEKAAADPVKGENIAYTLHFYAGSHKQWLRDKALKALDAGAALFVTEWGTADANGNGKIDEAETRAWWDFLDKHHISWCNWSVADKEETTAALRPGASEKGGWNESMISPSGKLVRDELRSKNGPTTRP